jgi:hypothetical protein
MQSAERKRVDTGLPDFPAYILMRPDVKNLQKMVSVHSESGLD